MPKYQAPHNASGIGFSTGRHFACDPGGVLDAPDDLTSEEAAALCSQGFIPVPANEVLARPSKPDATKVATTDSAPASDTPTTSTSD